MFNDRNSGGGSRGGKKYGGGSFGGSRGGFGRDGGKPAMHSATCSECGNRCEVPFKPNGKKPIFCSNCFKKDDYDAAPKRSYGNDGPRERSNDNNMADQFKVINSKLDAIIRALDV
jgi:CxxC-x17-CxxC domain-containing protein